MSFKFQIILLCLAEYSSSIILTTSYGKLDGKQVGEFHWFKHIPFAKPPIGKLRFQRPQIVEKWDGVRNATEYGPACMSNSTVSHSPQKWIDEDCLHLNVFTSDKCLNSKNCAVIVYIHGGDALYNSAVMFNDTFLLDSFVRNDLVLVIPAFRLGIFSHFTVKDQSIAPTNLAVYDILQSLDYVKLEIRHFGGTNKKITLLGHSFGGGIVTMMTFSPRINQDFSLFQKTIVLSAQQNFQIFESHIERTQTFAEHANCLIPTNKMSRNEKDKYTLKCLQAKTGQELLRIQRSLEESGVAFYDGIVQREPLFPEGNPSEFLDSPKNIPMLTGCTRFELDDEPDDVQLAELFGFENPEECEARYRRDLIEGRFDKDNHTDETLAMLVSTKTRVNKLLEKGIPTYLYQLRYPKHSEHVDDLYYLMGLHPFEEDENETHIKTVYREMVTNFAKFGHPGIGFEISDLKTSSYFDINWNETTGLRPQIRNDFEKKIMDYWLRDMVEYDKKISAEKKVKKNLRSSILDQSYHLERESHFYSVLFFIFSAVLLVLLCKVCCLRREQNLYIRIDGRDFLRKDDNAIITY